MITANLKVLVIDDDEDDYFIISDYLKDIANYPVQVDWCSSYDSGLEKIKEKVYSIYLVDYRLGVKTGLDLIAKAIKEGCEEPLILLTGKGNTAIDMNAMKAGATDYLVKHELNAEKLERTIRYAIERTAALSLIKEKEKRFRNIFENSSDTIFILDSNFNINQINNAGSILINKPVFELSGSHFMDLVFDRRKAKELSDMLASLIEVKDYELELIAGDENKTCLLSFTAERDGEQNFFLQGMLHDITERKKSEKLILQAEKLAAAGRFMRTLAHEVRNPLNNIDLSLEELKNEMKESTDAGMYLDIIKRNSARINSLITDLLSSLRDTGANKHKIHLSEVVNEAIEISGDKTSLKKIKMLLDKKGTDDLIFADGKKLLLALLNLVNNSIEAFTAENGTIKFSIRNKDQKVILEIADNGKGMTDEERSKLFEPYFTTKRNGLGLGMVSTLSILQSHNASIIVNSAKDKGTEIKIYFDLVK